MMNQNQDPKSAMNQFMQRYLKRPVSKDDMVYVVNKIPGQGFQAIVKLNCLAGEGEAPEFAGELSQDSKSAEKSAATQALELYGPMLESLPAPTTKSGKRKSSASSTALAEVTFDGLEPAEKIARIGSMPTGTPISSSFKGDLNAAVGKILRAPLGKEAMTFSVTYQPGIGYIGQVRINILPGEWGEQVFQGEPQFDKKNAEQAAAGAALEELRSQPEFASKIDAPKVKKPWPGMDKGKGKGKGKGKFFKGGYDPNPNFGVSSNMIPIGGGFDMSNMNNPAMGMDMGMGMGMGFDMNSFCGMGMGMGMGYQGQGL